MAYIEVNHLYKEYHLVKTDNGICGALKSLIHREYIVKKAVNDISFSVEKGEMVGYIGPNGAGKSTTLKILSGVLIPTSGSATVGEIIPYKNRSLNAKRIGAVFGQKSQLYWDLPVIDSFELYKSLYDVSDDVYRRNLNLFIVILGMEDFRNQPVRQLSLGQKMKANIALSLLHDPEMLYLDEPTIGLDVISKKALREAIKMINKEKGTTIILTTHDMDDIESVCSRLIMINKGEKFFDGNLVSFRNKYGHKQIIRLEFSDTHPEWKKLNGFELYKIENNAIEISFENSIDLKSSIPRLIDMYNPQNIFIQEPDIDDIVEVAYKENW